MAASIRSLCSPKPLTRVFLPAVTCVLGIAEPCDPSPVSCGKRGCSSTGDLAVRAFSQQMILPTPCQVRRGTGTHPSCSRRAGLGAGVSPVHAQQCPSEPDISVLLWTALRRPLRKGLHNRHGVNPAHRPAS